LQEWSLAKSTTLPLIVIAIAATLSVITYYYSESISARLLEIATRETDLQTNSWNITTLIVIAIWVLATGIGITVSSWNKRLEEMAKIRTTKLEIDRQDIATSNVALSERLSELTSKIEELESTNNSLSTGMEQLQTSDRLQKEFVNVAAHELRTPVQPILGMADLLEGQFVDGKEKIEITKAEVELIVRNARRLERLSSDILQVARIESGTLRIFKDKFNLDELITAAIIDVKTQPKAHDNEVRILYEPAGILVVADRDKLGEVVQNLLSNALKFSESGPIAIDSAITENDNERRQVIVRVRDSGTGIDPEILPHIFTKFVSKSDRGTGLGLFISRSIIEAHGGQIWGENNGDGKGATFSFSLPLEEEMAQSTQKNELPNKELQAQ
jgi:signal transduction histidine kinase